MLIFDYDLLFKPIDIYNSPGIRTVYRLCNT